MSVGFAPQRQARPPVEHVLWRVRKAARVAEARLRLMPHGHEFRVLVDGQLGFSRLFGDGQSPALAAESTGTLGNFIGHGWTVEAEPLPPQ